MSPRETPSRPTMERRLIFKVNDAADYASAHPDTVRRALESGELHGMQKRAGAHWRIRIECLDRWLSGEKCDHQTKAA